LFSDKKFFVFGITCHLRQGAIISSGEHPMRKATSIALSLLLLAAASGSWHSAEAQVSPELAGGWIVTSWTTPDGSVDSAPQRGLFLFTASGQYSMMYVPGSEPRPRYEGETQTDAEILTAYGSFVANSGRYSVEGNTITYEAYLAKDPNYMADWNAQEAGNARELTYSINDGILTLTWGDGRNPGLIATLRRPGQPQADQG
jgi:hypothetical protein